MINTFAEKWLKHFETCAPSDYEGFGFAKDCEDLGFNMDAFKSLKDISEEAVDDCEAFQRVASTTNDIKVLGNAVYSKWRYLTHWAEAYSLTDENRRWFIISLIPQLTNSCTNSFISCIVLTSA